MQPGHTPDRPTIPAKSGTRADRELRYETAHPSRDQRPQSHGDQASRATFGAHWPLGTAAGIAFAAIAWFMRDPAVASLSAAPLAGESPGSLSAVGTALFTRFALPFEIASLILLAAIVGAVVLARKRSGA